MPDDAAMPAINTATNTMPDAGAIPDPPATQAFVSDPASWADPALAAPLFAPGLRAETARRLFATPRFAGRASASLADRLGRGDATTLHPLDLALAAAPGAVLDAVARHAGAIWHARQIRALVLGADIAQFCARLGEATRTAALRHAALAPDAGNAADIDADAATTEQAGALADAIERDGVHCLATWIDSLPEWAAARVRLKIPPASAWSISGDARATAMRIVRTLAAEACAT
jgi:hypothetical protein